MAGVLLVGELCAGAAVKVHDHVEPGVLAPSNHLVEIFKPATGVELSLIDQILTNPEPNRNTHSVESQASNLLDIILRDPALPVTAEGLVGGVLAE